MIWLEAATWGAVGLLGFHYLGYPLTLKALRLAGFRRPTRGADARPSRPSVTVIVTVHNEAGRIRERLANLIETAPPDAQIVLASDGSTDDTVAIARAFIRDGEAAGAADAPRLEVLDYKERRGKSQTINAAVSHAVGEALILTDANAWFEPETIPALLQALAEPGATLSSGSLKIRASHDAARGAIGAGEGLYWRYESKIRQMESDIAATISVVGPVLAMRRADWAPIPQGVINDDAYLGLKTVSEGGRVIFAPEAIAWRLPSADLAHERERRARMAAGRYQLVSRPALWPWRWPMLLFFWIAHKVLRVITPVLMLLAFLGSAVVWAASGGWIWGLMLLGQCGFYALAALGRFAPGRRSGFWKLASAAALFVSVNLGALMGLHRFLTGRQQTTWRQAARR